MMIRRIAGATRNLGAPKGWDPDRDGLCSVLPIRDVVEESGPGMLSAWEPTPEELQAIACGAPIWHRSVGIKPEGLIGCWVAACDGERFAPCTVSDVQAAETWSWTLARWETTPAVVAMLAEGHSVYLRMPGTAHPPVMLWVEEVAR